MSDAEVREVAEAGTLYGTPDDIAVKLQALRDVGAAYVLLNSAGGPVSLRRFAREVMPAFAGQLTPWTAVRGLHRLTSAPPPQTWVLTQFGPMS